MPKAAPLLAAFNVGEISPRLHGRTDFQKYAKALRQCVNMLPLVQGPVTKRPGTYFVAPIKDQAKPVRLVPFVFSADQAFVMEFGEFYIRFFRDHAQVATPSAAITNCANNGTGKIRVTAAGHGLTTGWTATVAGVVGTSEANGAWTVTVINANSFDLDASSFANAYISGGSVSGLVEVATTYTCEDLAELQFAQSGDVVYIAHRAHKPRRLTRLGNTAWTLVEIVFKEGPFETINTDKAVTVTASAATGAAITLTAAGGSVFSADLVGALFYLEAKDAGGVKPWETSRSMTAGNIRRNDGKYYEAQNNETTGPVAPVHTEGDFNDGGGASNGVLWRFLHAGYGWARITAVASGSSATAEVISRLPGQVTGGGTTYKWARGQWNQAHGYPGSVTFHDQRLVWAGSQRKPDTAWFSVASDYENMAARDIGGRIAADQAITVTLAANQFNAIKWLSSDSRGLLVGTSGGEHVIAPLTGSDPFGPSNVRATTQSSWGSASLPAVAAGSAKLMLQRSKRKIRELVYNFDSDRYLAPDLAVLADHLTETGTIEAMAWQQEPHAVLWCARSDGQLLGFTYDREQEVTGWHRHELGGGGAVESLCCIPAVAGGHDDLWAVVRRTIGGVPRRYVEYLTRFFDGAMADDQAFFVDCGLSYDGWNTDAAKTLTLSSGGAWTAGAAASLTAAGHAPFAASDVGKYWRLRAGEQSVDIVAAAFGSATAMTVELLEDAAPELRNTPTGDWALLAVSLSGLTHLEGSLLAVLADGAVQAGHVVAAGAIVLMAPAARVHAGLGYAARLHTLRLEAGAADGTAQGKIKRIHRIGLRLERAQGGRYGSSDTDLTPIQFSDGGGRAFTGDLMLASPSGYDRDDGIVIDHAQPWPFTLIAIMPRLNTQDG